MTNVSVRNVKMLGTKHAMSFEKRLSYRNMEKRAPALQRHDIYGANGIFYGEIRYSRIYQVLLYTIVVPALGRQANCFMGLIDVAPQR